jgi:hypothetical protein
MVLLADISGQDRRRRGGDFRSPHPNCASRVCGKQPPANNDIMLARSVLPVMSRRFAAHVRIRVRFSGVA